MVRESLLFRSSYSIFGDNLLAIALPPNSQTVIVFDLPYAIPVPDGSYQVKVGLNVGTVVIKRVQKPEVVGFSGKGFFQLKFDKYGKSSFSSISLTLPWIVNFQEQGRKPVLLGNIPPRHKAKEIVVHFLNRFVETVRYVTLEYWVEPVRYQDLLRYDAYYWDGTNKYPAIKAILDTGVGGIGFSMEHPFQMKEEKLKQLTDLLRNGDDLEASRIFILNSKDACLQEDFRLATIESVTALEIVLYKFIRQQGKKLKIPKKQLNNFIKEVGLSGNIDIVLKMLTKGLEQIDGEVATTCKGAITTRNKILHEGLREVYSTDAENRIVAIEKMLEYLGRLIDSTR